MSNAVAKIWSRLANLERMKKVSPARRTEIARIAALARWAKVSSATLVTP